jgi:CheY-like chemotaxis protein
MNDRTILIVEDDETIRESLQEFLLAEGFNVRTAVNGREGLTLIREMDGKCLVLLDLQMPVLTGEQLLDMLQHDPDLRFSNVPVLVMTARAEPLRRPIEGFIRKPIDLDFLLKELQRVLTR